MNKYECDYCGSALCPEICPEARWERMKKREYGEPYQGELDVVLPFNVEKEEGFGDC